MKNQKIGGNCLRKRGLEQFADLRGGGRGLGKKEQVVFLRWDGGRLITQCTLSIHKFKSIISNLIHVLQCLLVRGSTKNKEGVGLSQISQKETFSSLMTTKCSWG